MDALILLLALVVVALVLAVIAHRRRQDAVRDDLRRTGDHQPLTAEQAAARGRGRSAWMGPSNFGA